MGSKAPPPSTPPQTDPQEDDASGLPLSAEHVTRGTPLQRIAEALRVSPAALYQLPNAIEAAPRSGGQTGGNGGDDGECGALIHAFLRISDPEERRRILALVQALAERT